MAYPINDLGKWAVGQLFPTWLLPLLRTSSDGTPSRVMDLTGVTANQLSLIIYNSALAQVGTGAGTFKIDEAKPGVVEYAQASGDMVVGTFYFRIKVNYNGSTPDFSDYIKIIIAA